MVLCARAISTVPSSSPELAVSTIATLSRPAERSETSAAGKSSVARGTNEPLGRRRRSPRGDEHLGGAAPARAERRVVVGVERALVRGAQHVRGVDLLVLVVEDRGLDRAVEELVGVAAEELVERVLARDVDGQAAAAAAGAAPHLAQRGDGAGERDADRGVERADVDAELQRVGGDDAEQLALDEPALDLAPLLGGVAGAVGRDPLAPARRGPRSSSASWANLAISSTALRDFMNTIVRAPWTTSSASRSAASASGDAARGELLVGDRRVPHRDRAAGRRASRRSSTTVKSSSPVSRSASSARVGDRGAGQHEPRLGAVGVGDPAQPAQHVADVGAEHAAVDVRLVDDDQREVGEEVAPRAVVGQDPEVQHVRVGEHDVGAPADLQALLARRVAVVDRVAHAVDAERVQRARLVLRERLGRVEVQRARLGVAAQHVERRELEAQRLARTRCRW